MKKKALATCLAGTMLLGSVTTSAMAVDVNQLVDVEKSDWFYPYVEYVAGKDYMKGISSTQFAPMMEMNRAMFVTVLYRLDNPKGVSSQSNFVDVPSDTWYTQAVNWAAANKIVNGIGGDKFAPDDSITREQICTIVARYVEYRAKKDGKTYKTTEKEKTFPDADQIGEYAKEAVKKCQMWGLIEGNEKGYMNPLNTATRAEVATIVQRLDKMLAGGQSSGGSSSGGNPTPTSAAYTVKATLDVPDSLDTRKLDLVSNYNVTVYSNGTINGDKDLGGVITDLTAGENETALRNALTEALSRVKGKSTTQTINGQVVTLSIDDNGVITASMSVKVTDITGSKTRASEEELEALIEKLQNGGEMTFTAEELPVMEDLLSKIDKVQGMSEQEIQDKIDEIVAEKPELEQVVKGLTYEAIQDAADSYKNDLTEIKTEVEKAVDEGQSSVVIDKEPVVMSVAMDLGEYLQMAVDKFTASKDTAIDRLESELGLTFTDEQQAAAEALYDVNNPTNYMTNNGDGTLTLKDTDSYFTVFQNNVTNGVAFYDSLDGDAAFYQSLLERLEDKYQDGYGISYAGSVETMAALMGDPDGIMVDENKAFRDDMTFELKVTASEDTYKNWVDLITGKWSQAGNFLPGEMPSALANLLGDYTVTVTIDKQ